jgi:hypothetical protein
MSLFDFMPCIEICTCVGECKCNNKKKTKHYSHHHDKKKKETKKNYHKSYSCDKPCHDNKKKRHKEKHKEICLIRKEPKCCPGPQGYPGVPVCIYTPCANILTFILGTHGRSSMFLFLVMLLTFFVIGCSRYCRFEMC